MAHGDLRQDEDGVEDGIDSGRLHRGVSLLEQEDHPGGEPELDVQEDPDAQEATERTDHVRALS